MTWTPPLPPCTNNTILISSSNRTEGGLPVLRSRYESKRPVIRSRKWLLLFLTSPCPRVPTSPRPTSPHTRVPTSQASRARVPRPKHASQRPRPHVPFPLLVTAIIIIIIIIIMFKLNNREMITFTDIAGLLAIVLHESWILATLAIFAPTGAKSVLVKTTYRA